MRGLDFWLVSMSRCVISVSFDPEIFDFASFRRWKNDFFLFPMTRFFILLSFGCFDVEMLDFLWPWMSKYMMFCFFGADICDFRWFRVEIFDLYRFRFGSL